MSKTIVKKHPRQTKTGRTNVTRHNRRVSPKTKLEKHSFDEFVSTEGSKRTRQNISEPTPAIKKIPDEFPDLDIEILDHGAGNGRHAKYLKKQGYTNITAYEPEPVEYKVYPVQSNYDKRKRYDLTISAFVGNTLVPRHRNDLYDELSRINTQKLLLIHRTKEDVSQAKNTVPYKDGYLMTSKGTFQKGFDDREMSRLKTKLGFKNAKRFYKDGGSIAYIYSN